MQKPLLENQLYSCFVSPNLCKELADAGYSASTTHRWKIYPSGVRLVTDAFDFDDYYSTGHRLSDSIYPPDYIVPAFTLKDCEKHLPPFQLTENEFGNYQVGTEKYFEEVGCVTEARLPDAFGRYLLKVIKEKLIDLNKLNARFHA